MHLGSSSIWHWLSCAWVSSTAAMQTPACLLTVCLCMYVASTSTSATCCGHREGSGTCTPKPKRGYGGLRSGPDWHIRAQLPPPLFFFFFLPFLSSAPKPHQAINLIKAFCIEFRRLLHTKAARNPVPGRLMSCCSLSF